jgi:hypothetical protein
VTDGQDMTGHWTIICSDSLIGFGFLSLLFFPALMLMSEMQSLSGESGDGGAQVDSTT